MEWGRKPHWGNAPPPPACLPAHVLAAWRGCHATAGVDLGACAIIDREATAVRATGQEADAVAVWVRLADTCERMRETPAALGAAAALAGLAAGVRMQGFIEMPADLAL